MRWVVLVGVAGLFALSWRHELYLIVVALPAAAITLLVHDHLADRADARRVAALALVAPTGVADATALERIVAADLAAAALGDLLILDEAIGRAEHSIDDTYQRALACERLEAAKDVLSGAAFHESHPLAVLRKPHVRGFSAGAVAVALIAVVATGHKLLLAPLALAFAAITLTYGELRRANQLQALLVHRATTEPAAGYLLVPGTAIVSAIRHLADGRPRVARIAHSLIAAWPGRERDEAMRRLEAAVGTGTRHLSRVDRDVAACAIAAGVLVAAMEVL